MSLWEVLKKILTNCGETEINLENGFGNLSEINKILSKKLEKWFQENKVHRNVIMGGTEENFDELWGN